jgi:hypothetical protein
MRKEKERERVKTDGNKNAAFCGGLQLIEVQLAELSVDLFLMAANVHYWEILRWLCKAPIFFIYWKVRRIKFVFSLFSYKHKLNFVLLDTAYSCISHG